MATLCKNCAGALVFDPSSGKMLCKTCGSTFRAVDVEAEGAKVREEELQNKKSSYNPYMECQVYICNTCGGEIIIHGTEASTHCVYCGNPSVVFSHVEKEVRPDYIIPFKISREEVLDIIKENLKGSLFLPKKVKNFKAEDVRGIYLPYWIVEAEHEEACVVRTVEKRGDRTVTRYWGRSGKMRLKNFPVDGCRMLDNDTSARLEPFPLKDLVDFDEDYLLGFCSRTSDITYYELNSVTGKRARLIYEREAAGANGYVCKTESATDIYNNCKYAMFPVWFVTFKYERRPNTLLINGQTGKMVGGFPWNRTLFWAVTLALGAVASLICYAFYDAFLHSGKGHPLAVYPVLFLLGTIPFTYRSGMTRIQRITEQIERTRSRRTFNFARKREEGEL